MFLYVHQLVSTCVCTVGFKSRLLLIKDADERYEELSFFFFADSGAPCGQISKSATSSCRKDIDLASTRNFMEASEKKRHNLFSNTILNSLQDA